MPLTVDPAGKPMDNLRMWFRNFFLVSQKARTILLFAPLAKSSGNTKIITTQEDNIKIPTPIRWVKNKLPTVMLGLFALALLVGIRDPDSSPLTPVLPAARRNPMPDFTFQTLKGKPWTLSQHRGHVVLLNFWATWCPPCQSETPSLVKIANEGQVRGLDVVGVAMDQETPDRLSNIRSFVSAYHVPYPVLLPEAPSPVTSVIQSYPTTYLIDRQGRIANAFTGALDEATLKPELERLLNEPAQAPVRR